MIQSQLGASVGLSGPKTSSRYLRDKDEWHSEQRSVLLPLQEEPDDQVESQGF
jgi:hypothetical protein